MATYIFSQIDNNNINLNLKEIEKLIYKKIPYNEYIPEQLKKRFFLVFYYFIYKTYKYLDIIIINAIEEFCNFLLRLNFPDIIEVVKC